MAKTRDMRSNGRGDTQQRSIWGKNVKFRAMRIKPLLTMIEHYHSRFGCVSIIDIGGRKEYWDMVPTSFLIDHNVKITCVNLPDDNIGATDDEIFTNLVGDGCNLCEFSDKQFHIAHANSVIEHVGDWANMVKFASEVKRVATSYFVQTPNFWFPIEPHRYLVFAHWLPKPTEAWLLTHVKPMYKGVNGGKPEESIGSAMRSMDCARLLNKKMFRYLFPEGYMLTERVCLLPKSFVIVKE